MGRYFFVWQASSFVIFEFSEWDSSLGLMDHPTGQEHPRDIFLSPNPAYRYANISIPYSDFGEINIYNILGNRVAGEKTYKGKTAYSIELSGLSAGVYFITIKIGGERFAKKIVVL